MSPHGRIARAVSWSAIDVLVRHGLNFVVLVILARFLSPADFGLVAMLALFVAVAALLVESGFSQALIQRKQTTHLDESTIFFFTVLMGGLIAIALCTIAPWIAGFYGQPVLEQMTYWMALNLFLKSLATIHTTLLAKELNFKLITKTGTVSALISGGVAIFMAMHEWGVWSLIGQVLTATITSVLLLWMFHSWRPQMAFSFASLRSYFGFGGYLLWTGLLGTLHIHLYALLIGKMHSVQDVGFFSQAQRLQQLPVSIMTNVVGRVAFPVFSEAADDKVRLARGVRKALTSVMFVNAPLMLAMMVLAEPLVVGLLGEKWLPAVPVLQVLTAVGLMWPLHALNINVLKAQGHSALNARIQIIKLTVAVALLLILSPYGILAIAYGQVVVSILGLFVNTYYTNKLLDYGGMQQLRDIFPYLAASAPMVLGIWGTVWLLSWPIWLELLTALLIGSCIYLLVSKWAKLEALENMIMMLKKVKS